MILRDYDVTTTNGSVNVLAKDKWDAEQRAKHLMEVKSVINIYRNQDVTIEWEEEF